RFDQRQELARLQSVDNDEIQETEEEKAKKEAMFNYLIRYGLKINYAMLHDAVSRDDITMFKLVWNNYKNGEDYIYTFLRCYPLKDETLDLIFKLDRQNFIDYLDDQFYSIYYCSQFENLSQAAIRYGDLAKIQHFITRAIVIAKTMHGNSYEPEILGYAAQVGRLDAIKLDNNKETKILADLLQTAVRYDQVEATQFLIEFGANKDSVDRDGQTLMHKAVHAYSFKTIRYLLSIGFDVTKRDTFGRTACNCLNERLNFSKIAQKLGEQDYRLPIYKEELTPEQIIPEMIKIEELLKEAERRAYSASSKKV
ncbi:MAG TPA: ankyrin repeat domain-containing protein, partial [Candidatus Saccharimonadales bacterium]|nr:ankyrin repeat domain-containing protein [Candidatus Saccharimonadales bacterium]